MTFDFKKVNSHANMDGNDVVDNLVRNKTKAIEYAPEQIKYIPYSVTVTQIHEYLTNTWKNSWKMKSNVIRCIIIASMTSSIMLN